MSLVTYNVVCLAKEAIHNEISVSSQCNGFKTALASVGAMDTNCHVARTCDNVFAIMGPIQAENVVVVTAISSKQSKRRKFFELGRSFPNLQLSAFVAGKVFARRAEFEGINFALKVEV